MIEKFKTLEETLSLIKQKRIEDSKFSWEKASTLLSSWKELMKEGCVSEDTYLKRRRACEGIPGMTDPCPNNYLREKDGKHFCGSCGCGHREMATLYLEGTPMEDDKSIRLWMPTPNCPKGLHKESEGTKNWKPIGGKLKQLAKLAKASLDEIGRFMGTPQEDAVKLTQAVIEDNIETESEVNEIVKIMEQEESNETNETS
jgi:hypothetical protein